MATDSKNTTAPVQQEPVADRAFLERVLAAMEGVIDVADRKTNEFDSLRACIVDLTLMLHSPQTAQPQQASVEYPTNEELEDLWHGSHLGHPADFAADVLERWGGAPSGLMGYGGAHKTTTLPAPQPAQPQDFSDAYQGAREDLAIWKKRALAAEDLNRKFIADINGQTFMGEPAQRTWVGLTDEDVRQCSRDVVVGGKENSVDRFAYAIEAKLKEKNT